MLRYKATVISPMHYKGMLIYLYDASVSIFKVTKSYIQLYIVKVFLEKDIWEI